MLNGFQGEILAADLPRVGVRPPDGRALSFPRHREDRFFIANDRPDRPGWVFVSEPYYPGWKSWVESFGESQPVATTPAMLAFQKVWVPAGPWTLHFLYDPASWRWGLCLSLVSLFGFAAYWYNWALRMKGAR